MAPLPSFLRSVSPVGQRPASSRLTSLGIVLGVLLLNMGAGGIAQAGTALVSQASDGGFSDSDSVTTTLSFSADGTKVAFASTATNLVPNDTNGRSDVFVRDLTTGITTRVSTSEDGTQSDNDCLNPCISGDGTRVAFNSLATNLVPNDTNGTYDIFVRDLTTGTLTRASTNSSGAQGDGHSYNPSLNADGTVVAFNSQSTNLVPGDTNGVFDVFVKYLNSGNIVRASVNTNGTQGDGNAVGPKLTPDGTKVAYYSLSTTLVPGDTNAANDIFVTDVTTGVPLTTRVSTDSNGNQGDGDCYNPAFNGDGTLLAFQSYSTNLVSGDTNNLADVFVKNINNGAITRVSTSSSGAQSDGHSYASSFSADGTKLAFQSYATNLVSGDTNASGDIFVRNLSTNTTTLVSRDSSGTPGNGTSSEPSLSADGTKILFFSPATNLVLGDTNGKYDVFVADVAQPALSINDVTLAEGNSGTKNFVFTVSLSPSSVTPVTVNYSLTNITTNNTDHGTAFDSDGGTPATLTIPAGQTSGTITVPVNGDRTAENDEIFTVNLSGSVGARFDDAQGQGTITNDDNAPTSIQLSRQFLYEHAGAGAFVAGLSATDADADETFTYSLPSGVDDNAVFNIDGTNLRAAQDFDFATKPSYTITIQAADAGGNTYQQQFTISVQENTKPTVTISSPTPNQRVILTGVTGDFISGGAGDNIAIAAVKVRLSRKRNGVTTYWTGKNFVAGQTFLNATVATAGSASVTWTLNGQLPPANTLDVGEYGVQAYAIDSSGNKSAYAERTFSVSTDVVAPTVAIITPTSNALVNINSFSAGLLSGTASDDTAVTNVKIKLQRKRNNVLEYWNGTDFVTTSTLVDATYSNGTWSYNTPIPANKLDKGGYTVYATAYDAAGNFKTTPSRLFTVTGTTAAPDASSAETKSAGSS